MFFVIKYLNAHYNASKRSLLIFLREFLCFWNDGKEKYLTGGGFWINRIGGYYGNSITAHCNGNYQQPYSDFTKWAVRASDDLKLSKFYVRGIGGQRYTFVDAINSNGGSVAFVDADGNLVPKANNLIMFFPSFMSLEWYFFNIVSLNWAYSQHQFHICFMLESKIQLELFCTVSL